MRAVWAVMLVSTAPVWASEPAHGCFRSPAEAVLMSAEGASGDGGFRLESVQRDALLGRMWALVRSCEHPERPAVIVEMLRQAGDPALVRANSQAPGPNAMARAEAAGTLDRMHAGWTAAPGVMAGATVQVVHVERNLRLEMAAVAERSAAVGQRLRVRLLRTPGEPEQFAEGIVRSAGLVELEDGR